MKIISPFTDYYDTAAFHGNDPHLLYMRKPQIYNVSTSVYWPAVAADMAVPSWMRKQPSDIPKTHKIFGFAGRVFMLAFKIAGKYHEEFIASVEVLEITDKYTSDDLLKLFSTYGPSWIKCAIVNGEMPLFNRQDTKIGIHNLCFGRGYDEVVISNPSMKFCYMQHLVSPAEAYIEMERFISNLARPEKPIPQMSNDIKIEQHGFDKFSFRSNKGQRP